MPEVQFRPAPKDTAMWFVVIKFPFDYELKEMVKAIPGSRWLPAEKGWLIPCEMQTRVTAWIKARHPNWTVKDA